MAATAVQTKSAQSAGATATVNLTGVGAGNALSSVVGSFGTTATSLTTSGQGTFTAAVADFADANNDRLRGDYTQNAASGAWTVTGNGTSTGTACCVTEVTGVPTSAVLGLVNHAIQNAGGTIQPGSITPTAGSCLVTGVTGEGTGSTAATIDTGGQTGNFVVDEAGGAGSVWDQAGDVAGSAHHDNVSAVATNPTWTSQWTSTAHMASLVMEFKASTGGTTYTKSLSISIAHSATVSRAGSTYVRPRSISVIHTASLSRAGSTYVRPLSASVAITATLLGQKVKLVAVSASIAHAATLSRALSTYVRALSSSITNNASVSRTIPSQVQPILVRLRLMHGVPSSSDPIGEITL